MPVTRAVGAGLVLLSFCSTEVSAICELIILYARALADKPLHRHLLCLISDDCLRCDRASAQTSILTDR